MINICEVGPRDGLQNEKKLLDVDTKVSFIKKCIDAGVKKIEAVSFVNSKVVPQMASAEAVIDALPKIEGVTYAGLVLSQSGLERALKTNIDTIHVALATSNEFNQRNARRTVQESVDELNQVISEAKKANKKVIGVLGTAFGCPYEGEVPTTRILSIAESFVESGCSEITLADTTGLANPKQVIDRSIKFLKTFGTEIPLGLHFHNTRGLGLVNVYAGYQAGVRNFDSSIAGLGGCPFAPKAVGNVCTEDMVHMFESMGVGTNTNLNNLINTAKWMENKIGRTLDGMMMKNS